ncbi:hypothetical protein F5148DRAFT_1282039 [Russula earlei]|uniref:Uncharacterized protein n=1 Tax=Russula earlei TaxID=71964 RepID=A0ACC0UGW9_9AGAM|nr:hypothetical protein F5148DRAFT_1282039 [Russula earlei]
MPVPELQKFIVAINDEFPLLEFLYVGTEAKNDMSLVLSTSFRAPRLRHLVLHHFALPIGSPLLMAPVSLVTLSFLRIHPSTSFRPIDLLRRLSLMPQLETLGILFHSFVPDSDIVRELLDPSTMVHATLPNLRWFGFGGASAYLDALLPRITTPLLEKLQLRFADELIFSVSRLLPYMSTAKNLKLISADVYFDASGVDVKVYPCEGAKIYSFWLDVACEDIDFQVYSIAEVLDDLSPIFSAVEHLTLASANNNLSPDLYDEFDRSQWRKLLRSFSKVKVLLIGDELVGEVSRCLRSKEEELPLELLPELKELSYPAGREDGDRFTDFIEARQNAGRPLIVVRR